MASHPEGSVLIRRVVLKNYKSIDTCDVELGTLTFLVGKNGSGKSNFLDALLFVADSLRTSIDHALRDRGGITEVRRRSGGHPTHFGVRLDFSIPRTQTRGTYAFRVGARPKGAFEVQEERCTVSGAFPMHEFHVVSGEVRKIWPDIPLPAQKDRLFLVAASSLPQFRPVYDALSKMGFYSLQPAAIRDLQPPDAGGLLRRDGGNLASVLGSLAEASPATKARIEAFLSRVVPGLERVDHKAMGARETLEFRQTVPGSKDPWRFMASSTSDGTLRALGVLVALFQVTDLTAPSATLVGIEEPEVALHPAALGVLLDALREASRRTQVLVTSHSPDILDNDAIEPENLLSVVSSRGVSTIGSIDDTGRSVLRDHLYTAGELLRMDELRPRDKPAMQPELFRWNGDGG